ncbi:MAG: glycoside hydrolase family 3 C-terminal domain-containing protein, partial [Mediterranea sp.]|nr:glycoside hydrolase family 3 C-terminal domain-containing protein [Mediterranea sp.]
DKLHACAKHFAVHSGPEWSRHRFDVENLSPRDLWETYLPAFKDAVQKAHVQEVMCAYQRFEGKPCCNSNRLLTQILRDEWGYQGIVVSDCGAISDFYKPYGHKTSPDQEHAASAGVLTGTDLECGDDYASLPEAVKKGLIDEKQIDISVRRLLRDRFKLGEMDTQPAWSQIPASVLDSKEHRTLALKMAHESIVLLQNKGGLLPLDKNRLKKVAVIGPNANDSTMQWANYNGFPSHTVTLLEGVRNALPGCEIVYERGCDLTADTLDLQAAIDKVKDVDILLFAGGISPRLEGEEMRVTIPGFKGGDRTDIELPAVQRKFLQLLHATGKKVVFINFSGSAIGLVPETESCAAIVQAWYPGQAGGTAIADVLLGNYNPAGRLPITFYRNISQVPDFEDYAMKGRTYRYLEQRPLFPFGYGLSYTTFRYGKAQLSKAHIAKGETLTLTIPVTNTGSRDGEEVVQVYVRRPGDAEGPHSTLRAFKRVAIPAGQTVKVSLPLTTDSFDWFDTHSNTMRPIPGAYQLLYGGSSDAEKMVEVKVL